jgi:hypothetical protein
VSRRNQELRLLLRVIELVSRPRPLTLADKKRAGLRYCRYAGYGFKWYRGRRVRDEFETAVIAKIVEWRGAGTSWYGIAAHLLQHRIKTASGNEWSPSRVRRACLAELRHRDSVAVP